MVPTSCSTVDVAPFRISDYAGLLKVLEIVNYFLIAKSKVMQDFLIVGVDVSKATLDICIKPSMTFLRVDNDKAGFSHIHETLKSLLVPGSDLLVVLEHTGRYSRNFEKFMRSVQINFCKVPALQIKRSLGVIRGKADKIDAQRIAEYAWLRKEILIADPEVEEDIIQLQSFLSLRSKLVRDRSSYMTRLKEIKAGGCGPSDFEYKMHQQMITFFTNKINKVEQNIQELIRSNDQLFKTCDLLRTIKGVGWIVACYMISCTANFKKFTNARKFNCYAGLAPFAHESGSSIKGRSRLSHLANKQAKCLLNLAAFCAIRCDQEMKTYYQKRLAEGKRKMSCLNIIRSKLVARMFAVIKRQSPYLQVAA